MEENTTSINDRGLEAISAAGAVSPDGYIDLSSISFDEFLADLEKHLSGQKGFPPKDLASWRQSVKEDFEKWQAFAKDWPKPAP